MADCRAYELVSPVYGGGAAPFGVNSTSGAPLMSGDGEHLIGQSFGAFCGTEDLEETELGFGAIYEFERTSSGWVCEALDPPASQFPRRHFFTAGSDLGETLWGLQVPGAPGEETDVVEGEYDGWTFGVREAAGGGKGRFVLLGPVVAPGHEPNVDSEFDSDRAYAVAGASADLSDVLFGVGAEHKQSVAW